VAEVTLITDRDQTMPVQVERSARVCCSATAPAARPGAPTSPSADLRIGDGSDVGLTGPSPRLAVAQSSMSSRRGQIFARIVCKPLAGIDHSEFLLVLSQSAAMPARPEGPGIDVTKGRTRGAAMRSFQRRLFGPLAGRNPASGQAVVHPAFAPARPAHEPRARRWRRADAAPGLPALDSFDGASSRASV
jgi:rod shape-determining protein MreC